MSVYPFSFSKEALAALLAGVLALFCAGVWSVVYAQTPSSSGALTLSMLDVGQGDALYIESPVGLQLLIDAGPDEAALYALPEVMPALDRTLDAVIATHPDADHIGGFSAVLERYEVGLYVYPGIQKTTTTAKTLETIVDEKNIPRLLARRGAVFDLGGGASLEILYPDHDVSNLPNEKVNEGGIVARIRYGETEALLMADVGKGVEARLMELEGESIDSDILKVGHHGSKYSSGQAFVSAVSPETALISVGADNSYGHPTAQALSVLRNAGTQILRTDEKGTVTCRSDGARFECAGN